MRSLSHLPGATNLSVRSVDNSYTFLFLSSVMSGAVLSVTGLEVDVNCFRVVNSRAYEISGRFKDV